MKYFKINAISNAQSDYIARRCQRCEDSEWLLFEAILLKKTAVFTSRRRGSQELPINPVFNEFKFDFYSLKSVSARVHWGKTWRAGGSTSAITRHG